MRDYQPRLLSFESHNVTGNFSIALHFQPYISHLSLLLSYWTHFRFNLNILSISLFSDWKLATKVWWFTYVHAFLFDFFCYHLIVIRVHVIKSLILVFIPIIQTHTKHGNTHFFGYLSSTIQQIIQSYIDYRYVYK